MPRVTELPIPRTPSVETGEVEALERLDQAIEQYLVHCQRSFVLHEAKPSDLFAAFQRFATDLLDVYASECVRPDKGPDFDACLTDLTGYVLARILPDPAKKRPPAAYGMRLPTRLGPEQKSRAVKYPERPVGQNKEWFIIPWTATNPDDFSFDADGDWEAELVQCLQLPDVHLFEDSGEWNPWKLVRALREPPARHQFEQEIGIALTRRLRYWRAQARQWRTGQPGEHEPRPSSAAEDSVAHPGPTSQEGDPKVSSSVNDGKLLDFIGPEVFKRQTDSQITSACFRQANQKYGKLGRSKKFTPEAFRSALKRIRRQQRFPSSRKIQKKSVNPDPS